MKKWNRILAAVLTLSLTAGLTACGGSTSDATANNASAADEGTASNGSSEVYRTLDEIKESGTINIGVFSDKNPFGYVDENGEYQGYDIYFANRLGEDLGVDVNFVSTEAANRIEYLQTGKVDIILANFTVTDERAEEVDFALPYMNVALGVVSPDSKVIESLDDWDSNDQMIVISRAFFADSSLHALRFLSLLLRLLSFDFSLCILLAQAGQYFDIPELGTYSTPHTVQFLGFNAVHRFVGVICNSPTKPMNL